MGSLLKAYCYYCEKPFVDFTCTKCEKKICYDCVESEGSIECVNDFRTDIIILCKKCINEE